MLKPAWTFLANWLAVLIVKIRCYQIKWFQKATLIPKQKAKGNVLIAYLLESFTLLPGQPFSNRHSSYWECWQIAQTFLKQGYSVDIIHFLNRDFVPRKRYDFFIDIRYTMDAIVPRLNSDCTKVLHSDTAYIPFHNAAEAQRLAAIKKRRGVTLAPRRYEPPTPASDYADIITVLGNSFTIDTFKQTQKPIYRLQISTPETYSWQEKDFNACRNQFLWFGSWGLVHKGLDLVLEAFAAMPDYHLTVCGPIAKEADFVEAYHQELYETANIHTIGWIDTSSSDFLDLAKHCVALVYPSCSEGGGGSALTCMHAGLIPIVSYETSVDIEPDYGILLKDSSIAEIQAAVNSVANRSSIELEQMAKRAWQFARENHTRDRFSESYRQFVERLIAV